MDNSSAEDIIERQDESIEILTAALHEIIEADIHPTPCGRQTTGLFYKLATDALTKVNEL